MKKLNFIEFLSPYAYSYILTKNGHVCNKMVVEEFMNRYERNISLKEIGLDGQEKLLDSTVLVCGCGGLGSTVIANLASLGIGLIGIVDYDKIDITNLNRQFLHKYSYIGKNKTESVCEWVDGYNPHIKVVPHNIQLSIDNYKGVIKDYDIIVDCFDSYSSKFLLNEIAVKTGKTLVHGGVSEFYGQVTTIIPHKTPCLRCILPDADEKTEIPNGIVSPSVSTIASLQSMEVLKLITGIGKPLAGTLLTCNMLDCSFKKLKITKNSNCPLCSN